MARKKVAQTAATPDRETADPLHERYRQLAIQIGRVLGVIRVTAKALINGETALEHEAADTLELAAEALFEADCASSLMWHEVWKLEEPAREVQS